MCANVRQPCPVYIFAECTPALASQKQRSPATFSSMYRTIGTGTLPLPGAEKESGALDSKAAVPPAPQNNVSRIPCLDPATTRTASLLALLGFPCVTPVRTRDPKRRRFWRPQRAQQQLRRNQVRVHGVCSAVVRSRVRKSNLNSFGSDFNPRSWTRALCLKDSDGDGQPNGFELGDPCCDCT